MKQMKYDIVVIGSGVGGLTTAALLSKAGYRTLIVEKLSFTGGRCATLDYHGYKLDTGVVLVIDEADPHMKIIVNKEELQKRKELGSVF